MYEYFVMPKQLYVALIFCNPIVGRGYYRRFSSFIVQEQDKMYHSRVSNVRKHFTRESAGRTYICVSGMIVGTESVAQIKRFYNERAVQIKVDCVIMKNYQQ